MSSWMRRRPLKNRFLDKVWRPGDFPCWIWLGALSQTKGYGQIASGGKVGKGHPGRLHLAHVVAFRLFKGEMQEGFVVDHLCGNRPCVNPDHLESVTIQENSRRVSRYRKVPKRTDFCKRGHKDSPENTLYRREEPIACKECGRAVGSDLDPADYDFNQLLPWGNQ